MRSMPSTSRPVRSGGLKTLLKGLSLDRPQIESSIAPHKVKDAVELLIYKTGVVGDHRYSENCAGFFVLMVNL